MGQQENVKGNILGSRAEKNRLKKDSTKYITKDEGDCSKGDSSFNSKTDCNTRGRIKTWTQNKLTKAVQNRSSTEKKKTHEKRQSGD